MNYRALMKKRLPALFEALNALAKAGDVVSFAAMMNEVRDHLPADITAAIEEDAAAVARIMLGEERDGDACLFCGKREICDALAGKVDPRDDLVVELGEDVQLDPEIAN